MIPKKPQDLFPEIAERHNLPVETIEDIVTCYWKEVKRCLNSFKSPYIKVSGLGQFYIKSWKIDEAIEESRKPIENNWTSVNLEALKARIENLKSLKDIWEQSEQRKKELKDARQSADI